MYIYIYTYESPCISYLKQKCHFFVVVDKVGEQEGGTVWGAVCTSRKGKGYGKVNIVHYCVHLYVNDTC
jgi:hypothetical protein